MGDADRSVRDDPGLGVGRSAQLAAALDELRRRPVDGRSDLLEHLAMDAVLARAGRGEAEQAASRLLGLIVDGECTIEQAVDGVDVLARHSWDHDGRRLVEAVLDAWWDETLHLAPGEHQPGWSPAEVLGLLAGWNAPMVRWFEPWLTELDGPGAGHLVDMLLDGLGGPAWVGRADRADQVVGWARTEPVVNGLILIGGTHLDGDRLSAALDLLI